MTQVLGPRPSSSLLYFLLFSLSNHTAINIDQNASLSQRTYLQWSVPSFSVPFSNLLLPGKTYCTSHTDTYPAIDPATKSNHTGHYVLITGASKGVGRATALSFAKAGATGIALAARSSFNDLSSEILSAAKSANK